MRHNYRHDRGRARQWNRHDGLPTVTRWRIVGGGRVRLIFSDTVAGWETAAVSWSLFMVPLDSLSQDGMSDWIAAAEFTQGIPEQVPQALPWPSIADVLDVFRAVGCHGINWFEIVGENVGSRLPECQSPRTCAGAGGLDLGEVSIYTTGKTSSLSAVRADAAVETVAFRKPNPAAVLRAACVLASHAGPQLVFDESADRVFAVRRGEEAGELDDWLW